MAADLLKKGRTNVKGMWSEKKQAAYEDVYKRQSWTTMRLCTPDMTNTVLIWMRSSMTLMC